MSNDTLIIVNPDNCNTFSCNCKMCAVVSWVESQIKQSNKTESFKFSFSIPVSVWKEQGHDMEVLGAHLSTIKTCLINVIGIIHHKTKKSYEITLYCLKK